jgi:hypothetical protein
MELIALATIMVLSLAVGVAGSKAMLSLVFLFMTGHQRESQTLESIH